MSGYWRWISKPGPGRPPIPDDTKALIVRMATEKRLARPKDPG
jgi:hypothetical protein